MVFKFWVIQYATLSLPPSLSCSPSLSPPPSFPLSPPSSSFALLPAHIYIVVSSFVMSSLIILMDLELWRKQISGRAYKGLSILG